MKEVCHDLNTAKGSKQNESLIGIGTLGSEFAEFFREISIQISEESQA
jgi:hypothetical protein